MNSEFYEKQELLDLGFSRVGDEVQVSRLSRFYGIRGSLGDGVRIDDFCTFKGHIEVGARVHLSAYGLFSGVGGSIVIAPLATTAAYVAIYTRSDDYQSVRLTGAGVPAAQRQDQIGDVSLGLGCIVGAQSIVMPGSRLGDFASVGAHCIVTAEIPAGTIVFTGGGRPRQIGKRDLASLYDQANALLAGD